MEALAAVKAEQLRELTELRRRLAAAEAGPSGGDAAVAPGGAGPHSGGSDDAAALRAQLRCTQIDLNFARGEAERAQALAEQHRSAAVSLERQVAAMQKNLEELRKAKEVRAVPPPACLPACVCRRCAVGGMLWMLLWSRAPWCSPTASATGRGFS